jgi:predicted membrane protein
MLLSREDVATINIPFSFLINSSGKTVHSSIFLLKNEKTPYLCGKKVKIMSTQIKKSRHGVIIGIILILLGGMLIADNTGLIPREFRQIIVSWQMLFIVIGIVSIVKRQALHFHGVLMLCLGIFFIIPRVAKVFPSVFGCMDTGNFVAVYWPVLLIVGGVILVLHIPVSRHRHWCSHRLRCDGEKFKAHSSRNNENSWKKEDVSQGENFSKTCVFSSARYIVVDAEIKGGTLQAIFGGIELDLRKAHLPEGETVLNIEAIFGGVSLFVPDNWRLEINIESVLGGVDDNRRIIGPIDSTCKLIIKGSAIFGGVEIRN